MDPQRQDWRQLPECGIILSKITQLYPNLELFTDGDPTRNTLFVLGPGLAPPLGSGDELFLIDPPDDVRTRFTLPERVVAVATTGEALAGIATLERQADGVAHLRVGEHLVDLHTFERRTVAHLPAVGLLCSGEFGQILLPPRILLGSNGDEELAVLRLLARIVRERRVQLLLPRHGDPRSDIMQTMSALAEDVSYIHSVRRAVNAIARSRDGLNAALAIADSLLPPHWNTPAARALNAANVSNYYSTSVHQQN